MALAGLAVVGLAISAAVLLVTGFVLSGGVVPAIAAGTAGVLVMLWLVIPLAWGRLER
jgi:hypothetical protein